MNNLNPEYFIRYYTTENQYDVNNGQDWGYFMPALAKVVGKYLYSYLPTDEDDNAGDDDFLVSYDMARRIDKLDFMSLVVTLIKNAWQGEVAVGDIRLCLEKMKQSYPGKPPRDYPDITLKQTLNKEDEGNGKPRLIAIFNISLELKIALLWAAHLFCSTLSRIAREEELKCQWNNATSALWDVLKHESGLVEKALEASTIVKHTKEAQHMLVRLMYEMLQEIFKRVAATDDIGDNTPIVTETEDESPEAKKEKEKAQAVEEFVSKLCKLADRTYQEWNGKDCQQPGTQGKVTVFIKRDEIKEYLKEQKLNHYDELAEYCYPKKRDYRQNFCRYVNILRQADYFGKLSGKELATMVGEFLTGVSISYLQSCLSELNAECNSTPK